MNVLHARELGLIQAQINRMRELDIFSELADLDYLAKLEIKAADAVGKLADVGQVIVGLFTKEVPSQSKP